jgi:hypothetical protein
MQDTFDLLIFVGRPASGKSEIIDFLKHTPPDVRRSKFHIACLDIFDDFPMLWTWFEEDHLLSEKLGQPRLTREDIFALISASRTNLNTSTLRDDGHHTTTLVIEFSRGSEHGGYVEAFAHLSDDILRRAAIVYVHVPFEESQRKNRRRANANRPESILEHSLPDDKLIRLYRDDDWAAFTVGDAQFVTVRSIRMPHFIFENADDVTTGKPDLLDRRGKVWASWAVAAHSAWLKRVAGLQLWHLGWPSHQPIGGLVHPAATARRPQSLASRTTPAGGDRCAPTSARRTTARRAVLLISPPSTGM